jgi:hypothetical protein
VQTEAALRAWLTNHHAQVESVWRVTWKAKHRDRYVSPEAVRDALISHGWIDRHSMRRTKVAQIYKRLETFERFSFCWVTPRWMALFDVWSLISTTPSRFPRGSAHEIGPPKTGLQGGRSSLKTPIAKITREQFP